MKVVTAGSYYVDIDAYAGIIAEVELLNLKGQPARAVSTAPLNESITRSLRQLEVGLSNYEPQEGDEFIVVDTSKESSFDEIVKRGSVIEVIDHHPGQEKYWHDKIGDKATIESVGAACTQIYERWKFSGQLDNMKSHTAQLLAAGILDNTLNLQANVTTDRDREALKALIEIGSLPENFAARYFSECQNTIDNNFERALLNDTKTMDEAPKLPHTLGQLAVWDAQQYATEKISDIERILSNLDEDWALNLISISEGKNYIISTSKIGREKLEHLLALNFVDNKIETNRLWLRKELLKLALE